MVTKSMTLDDLIRLLTAARDITGGNAAILYYARGLFYSATSVAAFPGDERYRGLIGIMGHRIEESAAEGGLRAWAEQAKIDLGVIDGKGGHEPMETH